MRKCFKTPRDLPTAGPGASAAFFCVAVAELRPLRKPCWKSHVGSAPALCSLTRLLFQHRFVTPVRASARARRHDRLVLNRMADIHAGERRSS